MKTKFPFAVQFIPISDQSVTIGFLRSLRMQIQ
jgi:hypothetical protein